MIAPAYRAQDGWTEQERVLYLEMWQAPRGRKPGEPLRPITGTIPVLNYESDGNHAEKHAVCGTVEVKGDEAKAVTGGMALWRARTGMGRWKLKSARQSLLNKGDVMYTMPPRDAVTPSTYIVFSFDYIVRARAAAGLLYYERKKKCTKIRLVTTQEALERWAKGEPVKLRPEHMHSDFPTAPAPPAPAEADAPPQSVTRPPQPTQMRTRATEKAVLTPAEYQLIHAALDGVEPANVTAEADLVHADRADNAGIAIRVTALKIRLLVAHYRSSCGSIHYPISWMLKRIGSMTVDVEAEEAKEKALAEDIEREASDLKRRQEAAAKAEEEWRSIEPEARAAAEAVWEPILEKLRESVIRQSFETWLKPTRASHLSGRTLYVRVPSPEFQHIGDKYGDLIQEAIDRRSLEIDDVCFVTSEEDPSIPPTRWGFGPIHLKGESP